MKRVEGTEELKNKVFKFQSLKNSRLQRVFPNSVSGNNILATARPNPVLTTLIFVIVLLIVADRIWKSRWYFGAECFGGFGS